MSENQPEHLSKTENVNILKRRQPSVEERDVVVFKKPNLDEIDDDDVVFIGEFIAPKVTVKKASEEEVKKFINSYEESIKGIEKQTAIMQKYKDDFDFSMWYTNQENMKALKGEREKFMTMMDQLAGAQMSLLEDSNCIVEDSRKMMDQLRIKIAQEQEFYKRISLCVPNNILNVTKSSKPEIPENFQRILKRFDEMEEWSFGFLLSRVTRKVLFLDDAMKLLTKPELAAVKFESWTPELGVGIEQNSVFKFRFTKLNDDENFHHHKWKIISAAYSSKSPEELKRRLDEHKSVLEEEEREENKVKSYITKILNQFEKVKLQFVLVKQQLEKHQKVQSELDEIEKSVKSVQDLIREQFNTVQQEQFNTVQQECPVCLLDFTNGINSERCPLVWQCGHTTCNSCSQTLVDITKLNKPQCPVCRKKHLLKKFTPNFGLMPKPT
ncbi:unnamed protein product [Caenorhabditis nigoni]|uniref:RING-type domain-containing protein n=1 Tax=Caenorhabditis nigoni TaxID=1611254 RepID=A0A2G5V7S5_9PELO|nr:hypothetical protein B9Z55_007017 [Caenorhabditis nigoni]